MPTYRLSDASRRKPRIMAEQGLRVSPDLSKDSAKTGRTSWLMTRMEASARHK